MAFPKPPSMQEYVSIVEEEKHQNKFIEKARDNPFLSAGVLGGCLAVAFSAWKLKTRDKSIKLSIYLIKTRVAAQSAVIGLITLGVGYQFFNDMFNKNKNEEKIK